MLGTASPPEILTVLHEKNFLNHNAISNTISMWMRLNSPGMRRRQRPMCVNIMSHLKRQHRCLLMKMPD